MSPVSPARSGLTLNALHIAAVAVEQMALFRARPADTRVRCRLLASGGDARLGGTDIDRLLAEHLLAR